MMVGKIGKALADVMKKNDSFGKALDEAKKEAGDDKKISELVKALEKINKDQNKLAKELQKALEKSDKK